MGSKYNRLSGGGRNPAAVFIINKWSVITINKTSDNKTINLSEKICVNLNDLCELLSCGKQTAREIASNANATLYFGRRTLYSVDKVKKYIESECV